MRTQPQNTPAIVWALTPEWGSTPARTRAIHAVGWLFYEGATFAPWAPARTAVEATATMLWILDQSIGVKERTARTLVDRLLSLDWHVAMATQLGQKRDRYSEFMRYPFDRWGQGHYNL